MRKFYLFSISLAFYVCFFIPGLATAAGPTVSTDTVFYVNFVNKPGAFTNGDIFTASTGNANKESTVNSIVFGAGPNGQRINMNPTQSAAQYGSAATSYISATADDDGATVGAFSFIKAGSGSAMGYIILPECQGPADVTVWSCAGTNNSTLQSYEMFSSSDGGTTWSSLGTTSFSDIKKIHKNIFSYEKSGKVKIKLVCTTTSNSNCNLYIYNVLMTKRPYVALTSAIATDNQTVSTFDNESIANIVYTWGSIANTAVISWSGTADANIPPAGVTVNIEGTAQTLTISGTPAVSGTYAYSVTGTNGTISTSALTGTITVVNTPIPLITLTSIAGTNAQKVTAGMAITDIQYTWGGSAVDANISWSGTTSASTAPDGIVVTKDSPNEKLYITGTPTSPGSYGWSITSGDNSSVSAALTGTLTVVPPPTITLTSDAATTSQTVPFCQAITPVVISYGGSANSASLIWTGTSSSTTPPPGITVTTNATDKTITISGMSYQTGTFSFSATSTDGTLTSAAITGNIISSVSTDVLPSFPGAVGYGSHATGGRKGTVYHVTNLDDSGTGSFRDAVSASDRIIVFDISGYINLKSAVSCKSNLTIAGQTAPGGGIGFKGGEISFASNRNIICRHIRIVPGSETADPVNDDALSLYLAQNVIMDHCTFEFAPWNNIDGVSDNYTVYPVTAITIQNCIDADPTYQQFGAHCESVIAQWTFYRNLFANSHNRNPLAKINDQFINNVEYNNEAGYTTHTSTNFKHDIVNNYFVWGPASGSNVPWYQIDQNQSIYYSGNFSDTDMDGVLNGSSTTPYWYQDPGTILTTPWSPLTSTIPTVDAPSAFRTVVSRVGALPLSQLDSLVINQVKTIGSGAAGFTAGTSGPSGGLYTDQTKTELPNDGYGVISSGTKETDTDNDGMPDYWEIATGSNVNADDAMQIGSDGYALIENYINWIANLHSRTNVNTSIDIDLSNYANGFSSVSPVFSTSNPVNGNVTLRADGHKVRFTPTTDFSGIASFKFTVTGSDNTSYTDSIKIVVSGATTLSIASTTPAARCDAGSVTLGATSSAGIINWYDTATGETVVGTGNSFTTPGLNSTTTYYVDATDGSFTTVGRTAVTATVNTTPAITATVPAARCDAGPVTLAATASSGTINWYAVSAGGSSLGTGTSFTSPDISTTTTYYVDATDNSCTTANRTAIVATANTTPAITATAPAARCDAGPVTLAATASSGTINWYAVSAGGSSLGTGTSFTSPDISTTTTYYVDATDNSCTTANRTAIVATANTTPAITATAPAARSGAGSVSLGATASDGVINWYAASTGGTSLGTGTSFTTPNINATTSYFVDATANSCTSGSRTEIVATINTVPTGIDLIQDPGAASFNLFPNPVSDNLIISSDAKIKRVEIYSMTGVLVKAVGSCKSIDMSNLIQGCYMVIVFTENDVRRGTVIKK